MVADVSSKELGEARMEIPKSALVSKDNKSYVVKVEQNAAHFVEVTTEDKNQDWAYVQPNSSLHANEQIVVKPNEQIANKQMAEGTKLKAQ
jgi:hypothetical protein